MPQRKPLGQMPHRLRRWNRITIAGGIAFGAILIVLGSAGTAHHTLLIVAGSVLLGMALLDGAIYRIRTRPELDRNGETG